MVIYGSKNFRVLVGPKTPQEMIQHEKIPCKYHCYSVGALHVGKAECVLEGGPPVRTRAHIFLGLL